ncbi:hypothetical protein [Larkinella punicea]|nr:hypothetical protein [Larkinella punicea]
MDQENKILHPESKQKMLQTSFQLPFRLPGKELKKNGDTPANPALVPFQTRNKTDLFERKP